MKKLFGIYMADHGAQTLWCLLMITTAWGSCLCEILCPEMWAELVTFFKSPGYGNGVNLF